MATPVTNFPAAYSPDPLLELRDVEDELTKVAQTLREPPVLHLALEKLHAAPAKPYDGLIAYADGTDWNPGAGEGVYCYYAAAWNLLG